MNITSSGDLWQSLVARKNISDVKQQIQVYSQEMTTGISADLGGHLRGDYDVIDAVRKNMAQADGYKIIADNLQIYSSAIQSTLEKINIASSDLSLSLLAAGSAGSIDSTSIPGELARSTLVSAISLLNTEVGGRALFSGVATDTLPLPAGGAILAELDSLVLGATTASEVVNVINDWFDSPSGYQALYSGENSVAHTAINSEDFVALNVTAKSKGIVEILKGLAMSSALGNSNISLSEYERNQLAKLSGQNLLSGGAEMSELRASLAISENRIANAQVQLSSTLSALSLTEVALTEIDVEKSSIGLKSAEARLQLIYTVIGRMSNFSLASYIR